MTLGLPKDDNTAINFIRDYDSHYGNAHIELLNSRYFQSLKIIENKLSPLSSILGCPLYVSTPMSHSKGDSTKHHVFWTILPRGSLRVD